MPRDDFPAAPNGAAKPAAPSAERSAARRNFEQQMADARAARAAKLAMKERTENLKRSPRRKRKPEPEPQATTPVVMPAPKGETPIDRAVRRLDLAAAEATSARGRLRRTWAGARPHLPVVGAFLLGLGIGLHIIAGPRAPDVMVAGVASNVATEVRPVLEAPVEFEASPPPEVVASASLALEGDSPLVATQAVDDAPSPTADVAQLPTADAASVAPEEVPQVAAVAQPDVREDPIETSAPATQAAQSAPEAQGPGPAVPVALSVDLVAPDLPEVLTLSLPRPFGMSGRADIRIALAAPMSDVLPDTGAPGVALNKIFIAVPGLVPQERVDALAAQLSSVSKVDTSVARVGYAVSQTHVRYYHPTDADAAARIAEAVGGIARDFTDFSPKPSEGTYELYLAGSSGAAVVPQRTGRSSGSQAVDPITAVLRALTGQR